MTLGSELFGGIDAPYCGFGFLQLTSWETFDILLEKGECFDVRLAVALDQVVKGLSGLALLVLAIRLKKHHIS